MMLALLLSGPALLALAVALVNLRGVPRARPLPRASARGVSVLVPARDEEREIAACLDALLAEPVGEVIVFDDGSGDRTAALVQARAAGDDRVRLIRGGALPAGWAGKPRACAELARAARLPVLLFLDADVRMQPGGVAALVRVLDDFQADALTAVPRQLTRSTGEKLLVPLLHVVYWALAPLWLMPRVRDARVCAANGQLLLFRAAAYARFGGHAHAAVRSAVVEDQAICAAAKRAGLKVVFGDAALAARCRMYRGSREAWRGFGKSLYFGIGATPLRLAGVVALLAWTLVVPIVALPAAPRAALPGALALVALRLVLAVRFHEPPRRSVLLHLPGTLALLLLAVHSGLRARRGVEWRGRRHHRDGSITTSGRREPGDDKTITTPRTGGLGGDISITGARAGSVAMREPARRSTGWSGR